VDKLFCICNRADRWLQ